MRSPACWTMPVTTSPTRSMYSSYIISRSASRIRCRITCFAVCAAMRPKLSGVTSSRLHQVVGHLRPVDVEVVVGEQRVVLLAGLLLDPLELVERALARLVEQPLLEVLGELDREDAEVAGVVELDGRVAGRARSLLVGGEQRVLERGQQRARPRFPSRARSRERPQRSPGSSDHLPFVDQIGPHDLVVRDVDRLAASALELERRARRLRRPRRAAAAVGWSCSATCRPSARSKCSRVRSGRSSPGDETSIEYLSR